MTRVPMTTFGVEKLREELQFRITVKRREIVEAIAEARAARAEMDAERADAVARETRAKRRAQEAEKQGPPIAEGRFFIVPNVRIYEKAGNS